MKTDTKPLHYLRSLESSLQESIGELLAHNRILQVDMRSWSIQEVRVRQSNWQISPNCGILLGQWASSHNSRSWLLRCIVVRVAIRDDSHEFHGIPSKAFESSSYNKLIKSSKGVIPVLFRDVPVVAMGHDGCYPISRNGESDASALGTVIDVELLTLKEKE